MQKHPAQSQNYFPAFLKLDNKKVLIIGGGAIACRKLKTLLDFTQEISLLAEDFSREMMQVMQEWGLSFQKRAYKSGDVAEYEIVIIAIDNISLQGEIYKEAQLHHTLCNAVDATEYCDFIFPSYIKKDDLTIAISTSGASPALARELKSYLQNLIPHSINDFLKEMRDLRESLPKGEERMQLLRSKAKHYIGSWKG